MRMKAIDSFHTSQTRTVQQGQEFEVHDQLAKDLQAAGLAEPVGGAKAESPPENKAEPMPENKAELAAPVSKATVRKRVRTEEE